eukprot:5231326-Pleurochrysis_carterae.AAC.1
MSPFPSPRPRPSCSFAAWQDLDRDNRISQRELAQAVRRWLLSLRRYVTAKSPRSPKNKVES